MVSLPLLTAEQVHSDLKELASEKLRLFSSRLIPTLAEGALLGVSVPEVRKLGRYYRKHFDTSGYIACLPHEYWEELILHGELLNQITEFDILIVQINTLLPHINDWASCDTLSPKLFAKYTPALFTLCKQWLESEHEYTVRFALVCLKSYFLDDCNMSSAAMRLASEVKRQEYYIQMAQAWFFAEALTRQPMEALVYIRERRLDKWVHNKSIQKACESKRIEVDFKEYLRTLKLKE
jgi:hypothetical protein fuD12_08809